MIGEENEIERIRIEEEKRAAENREEPISIAAKNLRLLKRLILGKNKPPIFLRMLCWFYLGWSLLMIIYYGTVGLLISTSAIHNTVFEAIGGKYFFVYTCLHALAFIGVVFIWRLKKISFYIYSIPTFVMPFLYLLMTWSCKENLSEKLNKIELVIFLFSIISIGLFAVNWKSLNLIKKKEDIPEV
tara:strand:- start:192 stop:749 length:558 start_codon:yes stop_codon:yes gene_type:complete